MLIERLQEDLKNAMRRKDKVRLRTIRSLRAALQEKEIQMRASGQASRDDELSEDAAMSVLQKQAKQRRDAMAQYHTAGRQDLVRKEEEELSVIEGYLPEQLSKEDIREEVESIVRQTGASGMQDMGRVMGAAMKKMKGRADGNVVQQAARDVLSSQ